MDSEAEIIALRGRVATLEANVENLVGWQKAQNGSIHKVRDEVNDIKKWMVRATLGLAMNCIGIAATAVFLYLQVVK